MTKEVAPGVFQIATRLGISNAFLIVEDELTLVDTGLKGSQGCIVRAVQGLGYNPSAITKVVLTHCHLDHAGGIAAIKRATGASVLAHRIEARFISRKEPLPYRKHIISPKSWLLHLLFMPLLRYEGVFVDNLLDDGSTLNALGGLEVIHTPGHSPGHVCLYSSERQILFPGDILTVKDGRLVLPGKTYANDLDQAFRSLNRLRGLPVRIICPSHGDVISTGAEEELDIVLNTAGT